MAGVNSTTERKSAYSKIHYATRSGRMIRGTCVDCGAKADHAHHANGYDRIHALDVVWLCRTCHHLRHYPRRLVRTGRPHLLSLPEASAQLGLADSTLRHQIVPGALRAVKVGRVWYVKPEEVERYRREVQK